MTTDPYLPPPTPEPTTSTPAPTQPGRSTRLRKRIVIGVAILAAFVIGVAVGGADTEPTDAKTIADEPAPDTEPDDTEPEADEPAPTTTERATTTTAPTTTQPATTTTVAAPVSPSDFAISMFIIENECYNTAGALITAEPDLSYLGTADLDGREFTVVFEVTGGGLSQTGNVEVHGDGQYSYDQEMYSTDACVDSLDARVTAVRER